MRPLFTSSSYRPLPDTLTIKKSVLDGLGLHSVTEIPKMKALGITHHYSKENSSWIRTPLGGFINHSENPNCVLWKNGGTLVLITQKKIDSHEELTVYYKLEEYF